MNSYYAFMQSKEQVLTAFGSDAHDGLADAQVRENAEKYGVNVLSRTKPETLGKRIVHALKEPMLIMLIAAAVIAVGVYVVLSIVDPDSKHADLWECVGIFFAIALSVIITVVMEGKSAKAFEALSKITEDIVVKAIRNGQPMLVCKKEIVAGDILIIETGGSIPDVLSQAAEGK
jgi:Ca2+-transporting ATPase